MDVYVWDSVHLAYIYLLLLSPETWLSFSYRLLLGKPEQAIKAPCVHNS